MGPREPQEWVAPDWVRLPDFIICGAMKCGTSTLHSILESHPDVFIPDGEINFFDIDDLLQHPDFAFHSREGWRWPDLLEAPEEYWSWYRSFFDSAPAGAILGEDSACYLPSPRAACRISMQPKTIRTIICLRHPTRRAYSQYWHMLRNGRAMFSFEDTIRYTPHYVLQRSMYRDQIRAFMRHIPRERVFFFVLEEFLGDPRGVAGRLADYLGLAPDGFFEDALRTHANPGRIPRSVGLQTLKNRVFRSLGNNRYAGRLPLRDDFGSRVPLLCRLFDRAFRVLNPLGRRPKPKMAPDTRRFLDDFFRREMRGLDQLVGREVESLWFEEHSDRK